MNVYREFANADSEVLRRAIASYGQAIRIGPQCIRLTANATSLILLTAIWIASLLLGIKPSPTGLTTNLPTSIGELGIQS